MKIVSAIGEYSIMMHTGIYKLKLDFGFNLQNVDREPKMLARKQLSLRFGHFPIGSTSALDDFFKRWQPGQI